MFDRPLSVKICGVTHPEDALLCAEAGVDLIGLNFAHESRRFLTLERAEEIARAARSEFPALKFVGVFVNEEPATILRVARTLALDAVQLHGEESANKARMLREHIFVIKAFRLSATSEAEAAAIFPADAILLDSWNPNQRGGTGETFNWNHAVLLQPRIPRMILAGGLNAENVADAIRTVRPAAVDVCSSVEDSSGRKDVRALRRFIEAIKAEDTILRT